MIVILEPSEQHIHSSVLGDICYYDQFTTSEDDTGAVISVQLPNPFVSHGLKKNCWQSSPVCTRLVTVCMVTLASMKVPFSTRQSPTSGVLASFDKVNFAAWGCYALWTLGFLTYWHKTTSLFPPQNRFAHKQLRNTLESTGCVINWFFLKVLWRLQIISRVVWHCLF